VLFYVAVVATGVSIGPEWYLLPVVPPGSAIAGVGAVAAIRRLESWRALARWPRARVALPVAAVALVVVSMAYFHYSHGKGNFYNRQSASFRRTGLAVRSATEPGSLIIVVDYLMDSRTPENSMRTPDVFYFGERRGWYFSMAWLSRDLIDRTRAEGARYLVITGFSRKQYEELDASLKLYLESFPTVMRNEDGVVYDLVRPAPSRVVTPDETLTHDLS